MGSPASGTIQVWSSASAPAAAEIPGSGSSWNGLAPQLSSDAPVFGGLLSFQVANAQPQASGLFVLAPAAGNPVTVLPGFVIHPDLTAMATWSILPFQTSASGTWPHRVSLPLDLQLSGLQVVTPGPLPLFPGG